MSAPPSLGVVVPHHSRGDLLAKALASVATWPVFVVDDSVLGLDAALLPPGVTLLRTRGEEGFAKACNRGLAAVEAAGLPLALLLNDDARPLAGCVERLLAARQAHPDAGAIGPVLVAPDGGMESAGIRVHRLTGRVRQRTAVPADLTEVDALSGACLLLDSAARLDERYRFGFEDVALCRGLRRAGRRVLLVPGARCEHVGGASLPRRSREATRHALAGHLRLVEDRPWQTPIAVALALAQVVRERGPTDRLLGIWEGWRDTRGF